MPGKVWYHASFLPLAFIQRCLGKFDIMQVSCPWHLLRHAWESLISCEFPAPGIYSEMPGKVWYHASFLPLAFTPRCLGKFDIVRVSCPWYLLRDDWESLISFEFPTPGTEMSGKVWYHARLPKNPYQTLKVTVMHFLCSWIRGRRHAPECLILHYSCISSK